MDDAALALLRGKIGDQFHLMTTIGPSQKRGQLLHRRRPLLGQVVPVGAWESLPRQPCRRSCCRLSLWATGSYETDPVLLQPAWVPSWASGEVVRLRSVRHGGLISLGRPRAVEQF